MRVHVACYLKHSPNLHAGCNLHAYAVLSEGCLGESRALARLAGMGVQASATGKWLQTTAKQTGDGETALQAPSLSMHVHPDGTATERLPITSSAAGTTARPQQQHRSPFQTKSTAVLYMRHTPGWGVGGGGGCTCAWFIGTTSVRHTETDTLPKDPPQLYQRDVATRRRVAATCSRLQPPATSGQAATFLYKPKARARCTCAAAPLPNHSSVCIPLEPGAGGRGDGTWGRGL